MWTDNAVWGYMHQTNQELEEKMALADTKLRCPRKLESSSVHASSTKVELPREDKMGILAQSKTVGVMGIHACLDLQELEDKML